MSAEKVILIFDIGKTNKKILLFNEQYDVVLEHSSSFDQIEDEDGFETENVQALEEWILNSFNEIKNNSRYDIKAVNVSAYGASFVYIDDNGRPILPLYNYLKPFPEALSSKFEKDYESFNDLALTTASPNLGCLNSGLQVYRIKHEKQEAYAATKWALHLPQYATYVLSKFPCSDMTSIGCHTMLWDFNHNKYAKWVFEEQLDKKLAPIVALDHVTKNNDIQVGIGIHDSSAALIPYLKSFKEPFLLLSTGTWSISLQPFNEESLTHQELEQDCLCYINFLGKPVKAARFFAGKIHETASEKIAILFNEPLDFYKGLLFKASIYKQISNDDSDFESRDLSQYHSAIEAYYHLIDYLIQKQVASTKLALGTTSVTRIFVDGGFSKNDIYMYLLAQSFPTMEVYAASVAQASALGAALVIHDQWNTQSLPSNLIQLRLYTPNN
jgi:L-fuculokinase